MKTFAQTEIEAWRSTVANVIGADWMTSPSQDEALNRLLSPLELGVEKVDRPPAGTPPYTVHPLGAYDLLATIGSTASDDVFAHANPIDGLYLPYKTQSSPIDSSPYQAWFCPVLGGQTCDGLAGRHEPLFPGGVDPSGKPFDVVLDLTTAHLNQALWAQARREDHLGSPRRPARLGLAPGALLGRARELEYDDVVDALAAIGDALEVRYHHAAAPYTLATDVGPHLLYVAPNIVIELVNVESDGKETVVAKFLADVLERDLQLRLNTGGVAPLQAGWREQYVGSVTTTFLSGCYGVPGGGGCDGKLRKVVADLIRPVIEATLLDMIADVPAPQLFDSGQESRRPRHLKNARTYLVNQGVALFADLCNPDAADCN
jgi:hypothetical protein